jgi:hypothetical protein
VGVTGRVALGSSTRWTVPFYIDVGGGQSDLTWQAAGGVSYGYPWGEVNFLWRHLAYDLKSGSSMKDFEFSGPMLGATMRW